MLEQDIQKLADLSFLEGARSDVVERLAEAAIEKKYQPGQIILKEGELGREVVLILDGAVEVVKGEGQDEVVLASREAGEVFGEMGFLENRPRIATVRATAPTRLLELSESVMRSILAEQPDLLFRTTQVLSARLRTSQDKMISDLQIKNQELAKAYRELQEAQEALIEKERLEHELNLAHDLQESMLPNEFPEISGVNCAARYRAARQVGGDLYDVISLDNGRLGVMLADVSGKGITAALYMALCRSLVRAEARRCDSPSEVLLNTNKLLMEVSETSMFVTAVYGVLDPSSGAFCYARAGHDHPFLYHPNSRDCTRLEAPGIVLGLFDMMELESQEEILTPGDLLIFYSDGITDVNSPTGDFFGAERLCATICEARAHNAQELTDFIFDRVEQFRDGAEQYDDMAVLVVGLDETS